MPSSYYVVTTTERSVLEASAPSGARIDAVIAALRLYNSTLVGPRPRIVRRAVVGQLRGFETQVTWVIERPTEQPIGVVRNYVVPRTQESLRPLGTWDPVTVTPWAEATNGPIAWWRDGRAAVTRTHDAFPTLGGRVDAPQNPAGPDTPAARSSTPGEAAVQVAHEAGAAVGEGARQAAGGLAWLVGVVAVVAGAYYLGPTIAEGLALRYAGRGKKPRTNPRPPEWDILPPDTDYGCDARARRRIGEVIPGRDGGRITGCATPKGPKGRSHHLVGRWRVGLPGVGPLIDKDTAARRIRDVGKPLLGADRAGAVEWASYWARAHDDERLPSPLPALDFPHRAGTTRTDPQNPLWRDWLKLEHQRQRGKLSEGDFWEAVRSHPLADEWYAANEQAARGILAREQARSARSDVGGAQTRAKARVLATARGEDVTAAEYRDALRQLR